MILAACLGQTALAVDMETQDPFVQFWNNIIKRPFSDVEPDTTFNRMLNSVELGAYLRMRYETTNLEFMPRIFGPSPIADPTAVPPIDQFGDKWREWFAYRAMLSAKMDIADDIHVFVEAISMQAAGNKKLFRYNPGLTVGNRDPQIRLPIIDLYQGYLLWEDFAVRGFDVQVGRQEIAYSNEWLLGNNDFYGGLSWDGARVSMKGDQGYFDLFAARLIKRYKPEGPTKPLLFGMYSSYTFVEDSNIDFFALNTQDRMNPNDLGVKADFVGEDRYTLGTRFWGEFYPEVDYSFQGAWQFGKTRLPSGRETISAYALEGELGRTWPEMMWSPRLAVRAARASGDDSPDSGNATAFNPIYQDFHARYGYADAVTFSNLIAYSLLGKINMSPGWTVGGEAHMFRFVDKPAGFSGHHLANEFDVYVGWEVTEFFNLKFVYANFHKGKAFRTIDGARDRNHRLFLNIEYAF